MYFLLLASALSLKTAYFMFALNFSLLFSLITKYILQHMGWLNSIMAYAIIIKPLYYNFSSLPSIHSFLLIFYLVWVVNINDYLLPFQFSSIIRLLNIHWFLLFYCLYVWCIYICFITSFLRIWDNISRWS